jgi:Permeases of the drug/metabolite transporter (DMT) superfamily
MSFFDTPRDALWTLGLGMVGATLAICMIICEFYLIMKSSAVVLMIGGVLKELTTIMIGVTIMGDQLNTVNSFGCVVVFSGVLLYKISHHLENQKVYDSVDMVDSHGESSVPFVGEQSRSMEDAGDDRSRITSSRIPREIYNLEHEGVAGVIDGSDMDACGTINKRRKGSRTVTALDDHHTESNHCRPLVQGTDSELI